MATTPTSASAATAATQRPDATILDHCYDEEGAAAFLGVSPRSLERWRALRKGPPFLRYTHRVYYPKTDLVNWAFSQRVDPSAEKRAA